MQLKELEIADMEIFNKAFKNINSQASEMSFRYLYMWRKNYNIKFSVINNFLCIVSVPRKYPPFAFCPVPMGEFQRDDFRKTVSELKDYFDSRGWKLIFGRVEERMLGMFKDNLDVKLSIKKIESCSDYIYSTKSLISLSGKKLSSKRNHINKFMREYGEFEYVDINSQLAPECMRIFNEWCEKHDSCDCEVPEECEKWACSELLNNWDLFPGLKGALIKVKGRFEAFTIGEMLNEDTAVIHIEKGNTDIFGIYPLINREFVSRVFSNTIYINREEDMGIEGLRKAKMSYHPIKRLHKYVITPEYV
jgi:hypothetical protein